VQVLKAMGLDVACIRVGNDNLFQSDIFSKTIAHLLNSRIEMLKTTGAVGAAIASGVAIGHFANPQEGLGALKLGKVFEPEDKGLLYQTAYEHWAENL
jgi:xylulokinase